MTPRTKACQHCNELFNLASTGRPPRFCSSTCRKAAHDKRRLDEAVVVAVARAVAAERRRAANRGNETPGPSPIRGNETRVPDQAPDPAPVVDEPVLPDAWKATERRRLSRRRAGMTSSAMPLWSTPEPPGSE